MKNWIQEGEVLPLTAPEVLASGQGFLVGAMFAVAQHSAASGATVEGQLTGVVTLPKVSAQAWTLGAAVFWDNTAKNVTTTASGNTRIGVAALPAVNPSASGVVRLNGSF
jgi:predicted RecA/RadA family phage recombinase